MAESRWRLRARPVIERALEALPAGATEREARKAIGAAYPFGEREHHPYKMWLAEVNAQVAKRFGPRKREGSEPLPPAFVLRTSPEDGLFLSVRCPWCKGKCLVCGRMWEQADAVEKERDYWRLAEAAHVDPGAMPVFCDWLEERGIVVDRQTLPRP
jgi:hypothetical protein